MGSLFATWSLGWLSEKPAMRPSDEPLQRFIPGAWAAWAKRYAAGSATPAAAGQATNAVISLKPTAR